MAMDRNNEMFPFAWAIVSSEDDETWRYFVYHLKHTLQESGRGNNWCIISERHKVILNCFCTFSFFFGLSDTNFLVCLLPSSQLIKISENCGLKLVEDTVQSISQQIGGWCSVVQI